MLLSQSTESYDSVPRPYFGHLRFGFDLSLPVDPGIAILGVAVSMGAWYAGTASALAGGAVLPAILVVNSGEKTGLS